MTSPYVCILYDYHPLTVFVLVHTSCIISFIILLAQGSHYWTRFPFHCLCVQGTKNTNNKYDYICFEEKNALCGKHAI